MIKTASQYHEYTSYERNKIGGHSLDWQNQPYVYKDYPGIEPIQLPVETPSIKEKLSSILACLEPERAAQLLSIEDLSLILRLTHTLTAKATYSGQDFYYRSAASAGALYPTEIYVATGGVRGLDDGLYHYGIHRHALSPLRIGDLSQTIARLTIPLPGKIPAITLLFTAIFFRSAWKYRDRAYRYHLLDTGHVIENMIIATRALGLPLCLSYDFEDKRVNRLLGLDETKEVSLALAHVLGVESDSGSKTIEIPRLSENMRNASIVSKREIDYPAIREMHRASEALVSPEGNGPEMIDNLGLSPVTSEEVFGPSSGTGEMGYPDCLFARRSSRNFIREPLEKEHLLTLLNSLCPFDGDESKREFMDNQTLAVGFLANNIQGIDPGLYRLNPLKRSYGLITAGAFMDRMAEACLNQAWLANSSIHFLFLSNLDRLERVCGPRGYRYAMLTAGRMGERIYVLATSLRLGCCGIGAFYDREAAELIGLNKDSRLLYLVAVGKVKRL